MGRTACTEPQCLYKGDLYLYLFKHYYLHGKWVPCHHDMARPQVTNGGTACNMESSCEYIE